MGRGAEETDGWKKERGVNLMSSKGGMKNERDEVERILYLYMNKREGGRGRENLTKMD